MASKTAIVNIALARIGVNKQLSNVDTQNTREAIAARAIYDVDRDFTLRDFPWPWATSYATLNLVGGSSTTAVNNDWQYSYRYPSDCLYARRITVASVGRQNPTPPPFRVGRDSQGRLIFTNEEDAVLEYTMFISDPQEFDAMFVSMLAWKIAAGLAPSLSLIKEMAGQSIEQYEIEKTKAQSRSLNESQQEEEPDSSMVAARD